MRPAPRASLRVKTPCCVDASSARVRSGSVFILASCARVRHPEHASYLRGLCDLEPHSSRRNGLLLAADEGDGAVEEGFDVLVLAFVDAVEPVGDARPRTGRSRSRRGRARPSRRRAASRRRSRGAGRCRGGGTARCRSRRGRRRGSSTSVSRRSTFMHSAHAEIAAFVAAYAASAGGESRAATDDTYTMRPAALDDLGEQREREAHRREVVDPHQLARRSSGVSIVHRLALRDAGVVDEHVDAAELVGDAAARTRRARRGRRGRSSTRATRARARGTRASTSSSRSARRAQMPTVAPRCRESLGERGADARRRAGHQHVLALQVVASSTRGR